ncbi:hypothetical protein OsI_28210 [Oryza sativa Indica Group]|uniref:Uncharacterized protein n=1 Tax=Oryza sativa subsp. indica TaxID=39946 RepID=A2YSA7_ORYSI|nr:hypothetical protein OsI_28210 [Oryza sativa Indica Group]
MNFKHDDDEVQKIESCFVQPSKMLPRQALWLSPLDIIKASRGHTPLVHFYQHGDDAAADFFDVGGLKKAMAKAQVAFYPFAGRLTTDADGRPSIDCNNEGVLFVVARSEQLTVEPSATSSPARVTEVVHPLHRAAVHCARHTGWLVAVWSAQLEH